jgi:hypothetical protein
MATSEPRQLPIRLELDDGESGLGFTLRALRANGIPFEQGLQWLGLQRHRPLDPQTIRQVAWSLNVDADRLGDRFVTRDDGKGWVRLVGRRFRRQIASNRLYAKLCPQCVRETGRLRLTWLLRACVGCPRHGYSLIWRCRRCDQAITWDRPDVDICRCGYPFRVAGLASPMEPQVQAWLSWMDGMVCHASSGLASEALPTALTHLSVDGAFRVIEALGLSALPGRSVRSALANSRTPPALGVVISRGIERMQAIEADPDATQQLAPVVNQVALSQLADDYAAPEDHALAWWLLTALRSSVDPGRTRAGARPKGQLPLFIS